MTTLSLIPDPKNGSGSREEVHVLKGDGSTGKEEEKNTPGETKEVPGQTSDASTDDVYFFPTQEVGKLPGSVYSPVTAEGVQVLPPDSHTDLLEEEEEEAPLVEVEATVPPQRSNWKDAYPKTSEGLAKLEADIAAAGGQQKLADQLGLSKKYGRQRISDWKRKIRKAPKEVDLTDYTEGEGFD